MHIMPVFYGEMQLEGDTQRLPAVVTVDRGQLRLLSGRTEIGEWKMYAIELSEYTEKSVLLAAEDAKLVLFLDDHAKFMSETERYRNAPSRRTREKLHPAFRKEPEEPETMQDLTNEIREDFTREVNPIIAEGRHMLESIEPGPPLYITLGVLLVLLVFLPGVVVAVSAVGAFLALLAGGLSYLDTRTAVRLPGPLTPTNLIIVGVALLALALVTSLIS
jgi:hypothetical protein